MKRIIQSRPDFIAKLGIAVEEIDTELCAILTASLTTARANWETEQAARKAARRGKKRARSILVKFPEPDFSS